MSYQVVGNCPACGAPVYGVPYYDHAPPSYGVAPPPSPAPPPVPRYSCCCAVHVAQALSAAAVLLGGLVAALAGRGSEEGSS